MLRDHGACFKTLLLVITVTFVVSVVKYPIESSEFYYGEARVENEVQGEGSVYRKTSQTQLMNKKLSDSALPTASLK